MNEENYNNGMSPQAADIDSLIKAANSDEEMHRSR